MKRDLDLVRSILLKVESAENEIELMELQDEVHTTSVVVYHLGLLEACRLIDAKFFRDMNGKVIDATVFGLTWDGQDYLDAMRDDRVWAKTKSAIRNSVGSTTFEVVKRVCVEVATKLALSAI